MLSVLTAGITQDKLPASIWMGSRTGGEEEQLELGIGVGCEPSSAALGTVEEEGMRPGLTQDKGC